jgi:hypothetical protein
VSADSAEIVQAIQLEALGVQNCQNKCQNMFNNQAFSLQTQVGTNTDEYMACNVGCTICTQVQANPSAGAGDCFTTCKNTDWTKNVDPTTGAASPITKGVIEPDKACEMGCVINLCQGVCTGGTPDQPNSANTPSFWPNGGCSIMTGATRPGGYYSQNAQYNYYNSPQGAGGQSECCSNAYSLCKYSGNKSTQNYQNVVAQAQQWCANVQGAGNTVSSICAYWAIPANCGNQL